MKKISALAIVFVLAVPVFAQGSVIEAPVYQVGDTWEIVRPNDSDRVSKLTVVEVSPVLVRMSNEKGETISYDSSGNRVEGVSGGPGARWYSFPLAIGKKWSFQYQTGNDQYVVGVTATKVTTVATRAGTFKAVLLEGCFVRQGGSFFNECGFRSWYAPSVGRIVKYEAPGYLSGGRWAKNNYELLSYQLVSPPRVSEAGR